MKSFYPGLRIIKTFISVAICLFLFNVINYPKPIYAAIACILTLKETGDETKKIGINRVVGTMIGGLVSLIMVSVLHGFKISSSPVFISTITSLSVLLNLIICKGFSLDTYVSSMACVVTLITLLSVGMDQEGAYTYIVTRTLETIVGIVISYVVNQYFFREAGEL